MKKIFRNIVIIIIIFSLVFFKLLPFSPIALYKMLTNEETTEKQFAEDEMTEETTQFIPMSEDEMKTASTPEQWRKIMDNAVYTLMPEITVDIRGYSENKYNIASLPYGIAMESKGQSFVGFAEITYKFKYSSDFKLLAATINPQVMGALNEEEISTLNTLRDMSEEIKKQYNYAYARELLIHNYITTSFRYAQNTDGERVHSVVGLVNDGFAVCQAYADAFRIMCIMCGIPCEIVEGELDGQPHAWNMVKINGEYYHVDVTSDDPVPDNMLMQHYDYFNVTDEEIQKTHKIVSEGLPECTSTKCNYFVRNGLIVHNQEELSNLIRLKISDGKSSYTFKTEGYPISGAEQISGFYNYTGYTQINVSGKFGEDGAFCVFAA